MCCFMNSIMLERLTLLNAFAKSSRLYRLLNKQRIVCVAASALFSVPTPSWYNFEMFKTVSRVAMNSTRKTSLLNIRHTAITLKPSFFKANKFAPINKT